MTPPDEPDQPTEPDGVESADDPAEDLVPQDDLGPEGTADADRGETDEDELDQVAPLALPTWKLVAGGAAVVAVVLLAVLVALQVFDSGDGDGDGDGGGGDTAEGSPSIIDTFDRADAPNELGATESGQPWEAVSGVWGISGNEAVLVEPNENGVRSLAVVDLGSPDGTVTATAATIEQGWGLVFRYQGPFNYWYLTAAPDFATYNLARVVDGEVQALGAVGLAEVEDGTEVRVRLEGATIEIAVNGTVVKSITDTTLLSATQAGLLASGEAARGATWDDFEATPTAASASNVVTPETVAPVGGGGTTTTGPAGGSSTTSAAP
jgi:hypothetical protein